MAEIINFLLIEQPVEAGAAILGFLEARRAGAPPPRRSGHSARNVVLRDRLYMAEKVQPVLEQLMKRVVEEQPQDVQAHFIEQLKGPAAASKTPGSGATAATPAETPSRERPVIIRPAADALFRMLDEDGVGRMSGAEIRERVGKLLAWGVPIDATAREFWSAVNVDSDEFLDKDRFFKTMAKVTLERNPSLPVHAYKP